MRTSFVLCLGGSLVAGGLGLVGCEKKESAVPAPPPAVGGSAPAAGGAAGAAKAAAPAAGAVTAAGASGAGAMGTASITGTIKVDGTAPAPVAVEMSSKPECVEDHKGQPPVLSDNLVAGAGGELKDVFVYVKKGLAGKYPVPTTPATIDQHGCMYSPHVFGMQVGQDLQILNSDPHSHNVNVKENNPFNAAMVKGQAPETKKAWFKKEGVPTKFQCDIHGWMSAFACVVSHPFWAVTGADGKFSIDKLPAGKYTIAVWHEVQPSLTAPAQKEIEVEVKDGETKVQDFKYTISK